MRPLAQSYESSHKIWFEELPQMGPFRAYKPVIPSAIRPSPNPGARSLGVVFGPVKEIDAPKSASTVIDETYSSDIANADASRLPSGKSITSKSTRDKNGREYSVKKLTRNKRGRVTVTPLMYAIDEFKE